MKKNKTTILIECAMLIALGTILAQIKLYRLPNGGSITAGNLVPFILISFRHGTKWGIASGAVNTLLQIVLGGLYTPPAGTFIALLGSVLFDYVFAYLCFGFADFFNKKIGGGVRGIGISTFLVCFLRFVSAFLSGFIIWGSLTDGVVTALIYSLGYNLAYMVPETLITIVVICLLYKKAPKIFNAN